VWVEQDSVIIMELSDNTKLEQWLTKQCWREWTMDDGGIFHPHHNNFTTEVRISVPRTFAPSIRVSEYLERKCGVRNHMIPA